PPHPPQTPRRCARRLPSRPLNASTPTPPDTRPLIITPSNRRRPPINTLPWARLDTHALTYRHHRIHTRTSAPVLTAIAATTGIHHHHVLTPPPNRARPHLDPTPRLTLTVSDT